MVSSNTDYVDFLIILHMVNKTFGDLARQKNSYRQMLIYRTPMGEVGIIQKVKSTPRPCTPAGTGGSADSSRPSDSKTPKLFGAPRASSYDFLGPRIRPVPVDEFYLFEEKEEQLISM